MSSSMTGRVVRAERGGVLIASSGGEVAARWPRGLDPMPTVGDWVSFVGDAVTEVLPRRTLVLRADAAGRSTPQVLAANVDVLLVCTPLSLDPNVRRLERMLAVAWGSGAQPVVAATKSDLCADPVAALARLRSAAPGVDVVPVSVQSGDPADALASYTTGRTVALIGASGVGKSSLINALVGSDRLATADIRADGKGRHTTSWRELVPLPDGGALIDTPGLRGVGLAATDAEAVARAFADVEDLAVDCRFSDCGHNGEPGCAVNAAVAADVLDARRVDSHRRLQRELEWQAAKTDTRLRAERNRRWRAIQREYQARSSGR